MQRARRQSTGTDRSLLYAHTIRRRDRCPLFAAGRNGIHRYWPYSRIERSPTSGRLGSRAVKLLMRICSPDCPRQQTLAWRAERKYHSLRQWNRPQISRVGGQAWTLRSDPRDQPPQRHGTSSGRAHVICQTTRVAAFGLAAGFTSCRRQIVRPATCLFHPATGDPPLGLLSQADLTEGKHAATAASDPGISGHW